jgi:glycosyltransferase involved in cell wall biosynthesis
MPSAMSEPQRIAVSVVIPAHNPDPSRLRRVLLGLKGQTFEAQQFEAIVVNNASVRFPDAAFFSGCAPEIFSTVEEPRLGLTAARLAGFAASRGALVVLVDDDNVLAPDYLAAAEQIGRANPFLGSWSGNVELVFEPGVVPPPPLWRSYLSERSCSKAVWSNDPTHNESTPWGAGMCVRRELADAYRAHCAQDPARLRLDLSGQQLTYGGDTDIAYFGCGLGFGKGVFPQLKLQHLIPQERCKRPYLLRVIEGHAYSEWLHHWVLQGAVPLEAASWASRLKRFLRLALADSNVRAAARACAAGRARAARELRSPP